MNTVLRLSPRQYVKPGDELLLENPFGSQPAESILRVLWAFDSRGPLDKRASHVQGVLDTLDLSDLQKEKLKQIVAQGHAAWRAWYEKYYEKVDAHTKAVQDAKTSGDKERLKKAEREKKVFMHTAPSLLRYPDPVRDALTEEQRRLFDERLMQVKRDLHRPAKKPAKP